MKCPECGNDLVVPSHVEMNLRAYQESAKARTLCCTKIIHVYPVMLIKATKLEKQPLEDDWGN